MIVECERNNITLLHCANTHRLFIGLRLRDEQIKSAKVNFHPAILNGIRRMSSFM